MRTENEASKITNTEEVNEFLPPPPPPVSPMYHVNVNDPHAIGGGTGNNKTIRVLTQRIVEAVIQELNREEMRTRVKERVIAPLIDIMNQDDTKKRVNDHVIGPLIKLMYSQMFPYLIVAAIVLLSGLVMWVLMFTMFALTYFRKR
jgi:hypothetical protein